MTRLFVHLLTASSHFYAVVRRPKNNLCVNGVIAVFDQNAVSCTREYANLDSLFNIIQYQCRDTGLTRIFISQSAYFGVNTRRLLLLNMVINCVVYFLLKNLSGDTTFAYYSDDGLKSTWFQSVIFLVPSFACITCTASLDLKLFEELTNHILRNGQKDTRSMQQGKRRLE